MSSQNIEDILKLVQEKGIDLPTFMVHNVQLLPPIRFDSLNVSTLLHTIKKTDRSAAHEGRTEKSS